MEVGTVIRQTAVIRMTTTMLGQTQPIARTTTFLLVLLLPAQLWAQSNNTHNPLFRGARNTTLETRYFQRNKVQAEISEARPLSAASEIKKLEQMGERVSKGHTVSRTRPWRRVRAVEHGGRRLLPDRGDGAGLRRLRTDFRSFR